MNGLTVKRSFSPKGGLFGKRRTCMAKVTYAAGIDSVSGALSKPGKNPQHSCNKMLLATHRIAATTNPECNRIYLRKKVERSTPLSAEETAHRNKFGAICAAVAARRKDLGKITQDNVNFKAQKDEAGGYKTMRSYLFHLEKEAWEANNG